ncbi:OLC1v1011661C1 [Oldenlandia corymbosa var. corymbosa]|uniref:OLC1v1011661C1 n=1 Tax=Oldenlandia corymbosa var. corymbosa TaxID=529605 RepID=A0AAV1DU68_OLDCO|nr:OLC1v1011661C1 [Oldenlandia corymbosa var. corymbosa]
MGTDVLLQLGILIFTLGIICLLHYLPRQGFSQLRSKSRPNIQANRHFILGAQFLTRARSVQHRSNKTTAFNLAKSAAVEADKALAIQPKDPAVHILKAMALDLMGRKGSALKSLNLALSPPLVKELSGKDKGDALFKRAELLISMNRRRRIESAMSDLIEAVKLNSENADAFCLLGRCYEGKGFNHEAKHAFSEALKIDPGLVEARDGLGR